MALLFVLATLFGGGVASAEPAAITKAKDEAKALQQRVDELSDQLEVAVEEYNYLQARLVETQANVVQTKKTLAKTESDLWAVQDQFESRLVQLYKQGQVSLLDALTESASFTDLIDRLDYMERITKQDGDLLVDIQKYRDGVAQQKAQLAVQLEEEKTLTTEAEKAKAAVQKQLSANEKTLAGKQAQVRKLQQEEAERQARIAAAAREAARKAALAEKAAASVKSGGSTTVKVSVPASASGSKVVNIAMDYLGCKYVWGGASPSGFDCSGFALYVYNKVGVSLPHSSRMQYGMGVAVGKGELRAGDLVFFGNPVIHHVGIYIGGGKMIHAAGTGKDVRIDSIYRSNYHGACRIIL